MCPFFSFSVFEVSIVFQGCLKDISSRKFQGGFKEVLSLCTENFKGVSRHLKGVSRKFQGCFKKVLRVLQDLPR